MIFQRWEFGLEGQEVTWSNFLRNGDEVLGELDLEMVA